ncbi:MAG: type II toxin-antitoxin system RelE/ParE family toxin [Phreatobacter sp.]|uniref:type II toxin-antitoxin system RelE/ParE family toxin n=1 Tax=Phreatobacter sp. TaxID=1966341 RepID=UPI001A3F6D77|nr:type II toxin-antitoxin system RelE/ParE family toxin [Phreatobacter sp.]MBL8568299.1 type II toxin-antitoxin system RelE/ParE family toxin [Phreatobacter sp.]
MARLRLSRPAARDIAEILEASDAAWGFDARRRYEALIEKALRAILADPRGVLTRDHSVLLRGLRSLHLRHVHEDVAAPVHFVWFRVVDGDVIEVIRVLHERMEPGRHIGVRD